MNKEFRQKQLDTMEMKRTQEAEELQKALKDWDANRVRTEGG